MAITHTSGPKRPISGLELLPTEHFRPKYPLKRAEKSNCGAEKAEGEGPGRISSETGALSRSVGAKQGKH